MFCTRIAPKPLNPKPQTHLSDVESSQDESQADGGHIKSSFSFKDGNMTADGEANVCRMPRNQSKGQLGSMFLVNFPEGFQLPPTPQVQPESKVAPGGRQRSASYFHTPDDFCTLTPVLEETSVDKECSSLSGSFTDIIPDVTSSQPPKVAFTRASSGSGQTRLKIKRWHSSVE